MNDFCPSIARCVLILTRWPTNASKSSLAASAAGLLPAKRPPACSAPRSDRKRRAGRRAPGSAAPDRSARFRRPADPPATARANCACPCDTPPIPARSPGARRAARAVPPRASPPDGVAPPSCGLAYDFLSRLRQSPEILPRRASCATPDRGLSQRPTAVRVCLRRFLRPSAAIIGRTGQTKKWAKAHTKSRLSSARHEWQGGSAA